MSNIIKTPVYTGPIGRTKAGDDVFIAPEYHRFLGLLAEGTGGSTTGLKDADLIGIPSYDLLAQIVEARNRADLLAIMTPPIVPATAVSLIFFNVKDYGAQGDGSVDDTAAVNRTLTAVSNNGGGTMFFPKGTYLISDKIDLISNITLTSAGGAVIKLKDSSVGSLTNGAMIRAFQKTDIRIENITINGNKANNDINDNFGNGIKIHDCQRVWVNNCRVYDMPRDGISVEKQVAGNGNDDILITNNLVTGCGATSQTTGGEGIIVTEGEWITIKGNVCRGNKLRGIDIETLTSTITNWVCNGNVCDGNKAGISINGATDGACVGNVCADNTDEGIRIGASAAVTSFLTVAANKISGSSTYGIYVEDYRCVILDGNNINGTGTGIYMEDVRTSVIVGNFINGTTGHGINFTTGTNERLVFSGNMILSSDQGNTGTDNVTGNCTYVIFTGNLVFGTSAAYGIDITGGSGWHIYDNILDDSGATGNLNDGGTATRIRNNGGFITEKSGSDSIASGTTSKTITHTLQKTPSAEHIAVIGKINPTNNVGTIWVDTITSTQFNVNVENDPGASNWDFGWRAHIL